MNKTIEVISSTVKLEIENGAKPPIVFNVYHNLIQLPSGMTFEGAVVNWSARTTVHTAASLCKYIMEKAKMHNTGHIAITEAQFLKSKHIYKQINPPDHATEH